MSITMCLLLVVLLLMSSCDCARNSRVVRTRQGRVQGMVLVPDGPGLGPVEAFLGLPYASPPVGRLRFMPPVEPQGWEPGEIRRVTEFGPVCPQIIPDLSDEQEALRFMTVGRMNYLKKLFNFLKRNQNEDCLYLNIYAPEAFGRSYSAKMPVIVFVHGESYEWNSGNPYDGSVLASYGQVVVVTLNYRLGLLGFLRTGLQENVVGNFGLLDLISALIWIKENIGQFGGDPESVTLMGHGTGAALSGLLLLSPVSQGNSLFHRAILMSGSSLATSAVVPDPRDVTRQVAAQTGCPLDVDLADCLRGKDVRQLLDVAVQSPPYTSPVGPYVDGTIIPDLPHNLMEGYSAKTDLMFGVTESESFHLFPAYTVSYGIGDEEQQKILQSLIHSEFSAQGEQLDQILKTVFNEYRNFHQTREDKMVNLGLLLEIFSDARVVAPLVRAANMQSNSERASYLYVFKHTTEAGYYPEHGAGGIRFGSVHGEEMAYVLGMPLVGGTYHFVHNYTNQERLLSEHVMSFWVNFAKTGNPGSRSSSAGRSSSPPVFWPPYDAGQRKHMVLDLEPRVDAHYRGHKLAVWNNLVPGLVESSQPPQHPPHSPQFPQFTTTSAPERSKGNITFTPGPHVLFPSEGFTVDSLSILVVAIGIVSLAISIFICAFVIRLNKKVQKREDQLERKIKRLSDAGFMVEGTPSSQGSHQQGCVVDRDIQLQSSTKKVQHWINRNVRFSGTDCGDASCQYNYPALVRQDSGQGGTGSRRAHTTLRSNSVKEAHSGGDGTVLLKSALKKQNPNSTEVLSGEGGGGNPRSVVYSDQSFTDTYPRQAKSIPNINLHNQGRDEVDEMRGENLQRDRPLSKSSSILEREARQMGPDVLVVYDTKMSEEREAEEGEKKKKSLLGKAAASLKGVMGKEPVASPIIELVPAHEQQQQQQQAKPNTFQFPERPPSHFGEPVYGATRLRHPGAAGSHYGPVGITYPVYGQTGPPCPLYPRLPARPAPPPGYVSMMPTQLTTPRPHGSLPRPNGTLTRHPRGPWPEEQGVPLRGPWPDEHCLYSSPRPILSRVPSLEQHQVPRPRPPDQGHDSMPRIRPLGQSQDQVPRSSRPPDLVEGQASPTPVLTTPSVLRDSLPTSNTAANQNVQSTNNNNNNNMPENRSNGKVAASLPIYITPYSLSTTTTTTTSNSQERGNREAEGGGSLEGSVTKDCSEGRDDDNEQAAKSVQPKTPVLRKVGEKTPPGTLKRDRPKSSCKTWYDQYSQAFLSKTIDTPALDLPPLGDEEDLEDEELTSDSDCRSQKLRSRSNSLTKSQ